ncbi:M48 family metallopeptidase [Paragemmobacter straminiformis]|uniref:M48 family metalloprotease n=1 Tax=Paragemmobacter straminiformis TaxID=2045119 RepID=A0A842IAN8_9RHOB|nr:M48 family metallopeptidase [Gemmobacter straminiformis]MBC2836725.1 M48 family metalloprotease [Gemmobacter straminiformis]
MRIWAWALWVAVGLTTACAPVYPVGPVAPPPGVDLARPAVSERLQPRDAARNFIQVVQRVEPMTEAMCRARNIALNCDFLIVIDDRPGQPPNAFQTLDRRGRPVLGFTLALIADARNADEIAFVLGHEASHHILGHIPQQKQTATQGAVLAGILAQAAGGDAAAVRQAQEMGATMGARSYAKNFELEADALGAEIALRAGYDPVIGTGFFDRLPDPGDAFLGTHPANAQRKAQVRAVVARLLAAGV